jgi:hypothetical protein
MMQSPSDTLTIPQPDKKFDRFSWNSKARHGVLKSPINGTFTKSNENRLHACTLFQRKVKKQHINYVLTFRRCLLLPFSGYFKSYCLTLDVATFIRTLHLIYTNPHGVTSRKTDLFTSTAGSNSNFEQNLTFKIKDAHLDRFNTL